jgi:hypothetical protein
MDAFEAKDDDPVSAWELIVELAHGAPSDDALRTFGAGEPEDLIESHGEQLIARIEADARNDDKLRRMLCGAWQTTAMSDALWARIDALLSEYPLDDREGRGQSPALRALRARGLWQGVPYPGGRERIAKLMGEAKRSYTAEEIALHVGLTTAEVSAEIDAGTLYGYAERSYRAPLVAVLARYFPDVRRDSP